MRAAVVLASTLALGACSAEPPAAYPDAGTPAPDAGADAGADAATPVLGLHVEGNHLVDDGKTVRLLGVNHSGAEYACAQGYAIFEGPSDDTLVLPMLPWKVNAVRLPVNEQCWLGINGIDAKYSGKTYQDAIAAEIAAIRSHGVYVILDLHWAAPGTHVPKEQQPMADADHAADFWKSAAARFKDDRGVLFDVFNEPYLDKTNSDAADPWQCLLSGCNVTKPNNFTGTYPTAGTQSLVDAIRSTGAKNVIMVPGLAYTSDLSGWLTHMPKDPEAQLAASLHLYNFNGCTDATCWASRYEALAASVPVITGENGENDCAHGFVDAFMTWADGKGISYLGWTWNTWNCAQGPALITDYSGTATSFGEGLKAHLLGL